MLVRLANLLSLVAMVLLGSIALLYLPAAFGSFEREPEDFWIMLGMVVASTVIGTLSFWKLMGTHLKRRFVVAQFCANLAVILSLGLFFALSQDEAGQVICLAAALGPLAWLVERCLWSRERPRSA